MMFGNFNIRPFTPEDRLFLISAGTFDILTEISKRSKENVIALDDADKELVREIHSKALHFLDCGAKGEVFNLTMSFLETLFKCLWEEQLNIESVSASAEKLAIECSRFSQFRQGEPVPVEIIQFALS